MQRSRKPTGGFMNDQVLRSSSRSTSYQSSSRSREPRYSPSLTLSRSHRDDYFGGMSRESEYRLANDRDILQDDSYLGGYSQSATIDERRIRAINAQVQLANASQSSASGYAQIHPKMTFEGRFPPDFPVALQLEQVCSFSERCLDRIFDGYGMDALSNGFGGGSSASRLGGFGQGFDTGFGRHGRGEKLVMLLEFLGARDVAMQLRDGYTCEYGNDYGTRRRGLDYRDR